MPWFSIHWPILAVCASILLAGAMIASALTRVQWQLRRQGFLLRCTLYRVYDLDPEEVITMLGQPRSRGQR